MPNLKPNYYTVKTSIQLRRNCYECGARHIEDINTSDVFRVNNRVNDEYVEITKMGYIEDAQVVYVGADYIQDYTWDNESGDFTKHFEKCELPNRPSYMVVSTLRDDANWARLRQLERMVIAYEAEFIRLRKLTDSRLAKEDNLVNQDIAPKKGHDNESKV